MEDSAELPKNKGETDPVVIPLTQVDASNNDPTNTPAKLGDNSNNDLLVYTPISTMNDKNAFNFSKTNIMFVIIIILLIFILFIYMNDIPKLPNIFLY
jgi:hypothetical protein